MSKNIFPEKFPNIGLKFHLYLEPKSNIKDISCIGLQSRIKLKNSFPFQHLKFIPIDRNTFLP